VVDERERQVCEHIAQREGELVALLQALIGFDTVAASGSELPALQQHLAGRLERAALRRIRPSSRAIRSPSRGSRSPVSRSSSRASAAPAEEGRCC
jgi:hypothetical protein